MPVAPLSKPKKTSKQKPVGLVIPVVSKDEHGPIYQYPTHHSAVQECFDPWKHGYFRVKNKLMYKAPDGRYYPATGVDSFGPFPDKPMGFRW
jgi:hypothetical protein